MNHEAAKDLRIAQLANDSLRTLLNLLTQMLQERCNADDATIETVRVSLEAAYEIGLSHSVEGWKDKERIVKWCLSSKACSVDRVRTANSLMAMDRPPR